MEVGEGADLTRAEIVGRDELDWCLGVLEERLALLFTRRAREGLVDG